MTEISPSHLQLHVLLPEPSIVVSMSSRGNSIPPSQLIQRFYKRLEQYGQHLLYELGLASASPRDFQFRKELLQKCQITDS
jgi:hypothetical protein